MLLVPHPGEFAWIFLHWLSDKKYNRTNENENWLPWLDDVRIFSGSGDITAMSFEADHAIFRTRQELETETTNIVSI